MLDSIKTLLFFTLITGIIYPLFITGFAKIFFPYSSNGSIVTLGEVPVGSELLAQKFTNDRYFWPRPSACDYKTTPSCGSNEGPLSKKLFQTTQNKLTSFKSEGEEMFFSSGSGLDPHISLQAALFQLDRIAKARNFTPSERENLFKLISNLKEEKSLALFGKERINVLLLNLELDKSEKRRR